MFYKEEDISKELVCPKCTNRFDDPRTLPCGNSLCQMCILNHQVDNQTKTMNKCFCCQENHPLPKEGEFAKNKFIIKLLEKKPTEVKRGTLGEQLKKSIKTLTDKKDELENYLKSGDQKVSDYLSEIRTQIDLITETQIERLNKARESLLDELKQYQTECFYSKRTNHTELFRKLDECNEKMLKCLNGTEWDENYVIEKINEMKNLVSMCSKANVNFEQEIFLNKKPTFTPSLFNDTVYIGKLNFGNFDITNESGINQNMIVQNVISLRDKISILCNPGNAYSNNDNLGWISRLTKHKYLKEISLGENIKSCYQLSDLKNNLIIKNKENLSEAVFLLDIDKMQLESFLNKYNRTILINTAFHDDNLFLYCQDLLGNLHNFMCRYKNGKKHKLIEAYGSCQPLLKYIHKMAANDNYLYCFCNNIVIAYKYDQNTIKHVNVDFTIPVAKNAKRIKVDNKFIYVLNESLLQKFINSLYIYNLNNGDHLITINDQNLIDIFPIEDGVIAGLYYGSLNLLIDVYDVNEQSTEKKQTINLPLQNSDFDFVCFSKNKLILLDNKTSNMMSFCSS